MPAFPASLPPSRHPACLCSQPAILPIVLAAFPARFPACNSRRPCVSEYLSNQVAGMAFKTACLPPSFSRFSSPPASPGRLTPCLPIQPACYCLPSSPISPPACRSILSAYMTACPACQNDCLSSQAAFPSGTLVCLPCACLTLQPARLCL